MFYSTGPCSYVHVGVRSFRRLTISPTNIFMGKVDKIPAEAMEAYERDGSKQGILKGEVSLYH